MGLDEEAAREAFEAYCRAMGVSRSWWDLPTIERQAWRATADRLAEFAVERMGP